MRSSGQSSSTAERACKRAIAKQLFGVKLQRNAPSRMWLTGFRVDFRQTGVMDDRQFDADIVPGFRSGWGRASEVECRSSRG